MSAIEIKEVVITPPPVRFDRGARYEATFTASNGTVFAVTMELRDHYQMLNVSSTGVGDHRNFASVNPPLELLDRELASWREDFIGQARARFSERVA